MADSRQLARRREFLFLYSVKDANPNGDPLNENHPRFDGDTMQAMASDVRIKRTIRDELLREGKEVFIDAKPKSMKDRVEELRKTLGMSQASGKDLMQKCIDVRLFGVTFAHEKKGATKEAFAWTGPVQFKWARSLHAATFDFVQGTAAFARGEGDDQTKQQRSFRNEYKVPFALMAVYGIANQYARETGVSEEDVDCMLEALWRGTDNLITRSKTEQKSRFLLVVSYKEGFSGKIAGFDERVRLIAKDDHEFSVDEQKSLRSLSQVVVDVTDLSKAVARKADEIEKVELVLDPEVHLKGADDLKGLKQFSLEAR